MNKLLASLHRPQVQVENSVPLRVVTTIMALTGVCTAWQLTECPWWLGAFSISGCVAGSYISWRRRSSRNFVVKIWITIGILIVASLFFNELLLLANANIADARIPLTKLLMALIALHCFDLPRRRDLSVSALVGVTLMTVASTLSRDLYFSWYAGCFLILSVCMFQLDCSSRSLSRARANRAEQTVPADVGAPGPENLRMAKSKFGRKDLWCISVCSAIVLAVTVVLFAFFPRIHINLQQLKFGGSLPYQMNMLSMPIPTLNPDGSVKSAPNAYSGFSEELDTNYRGELGNEVVLRVSSNNGVYLRGMAYDLFDGKVWRMSHPKQVKDQVAGLGNCFDLSTQLPLSHVRYKTITQEIFVEEDSSNLVVCAAVPFQIYFPSANLELDTYRSLRSPVGVKKDMVYTVFSRVPMFDFPAMRSAPDISAQEKAKEAARFSGFLQLPQRFAPSVAKLAAKVTGNKGNNYLKAQLLSNYLQSHFAYDLNAEPSPLNTDSVSNFLFNKKRGSCEHFASALVIMCRTQGIPAMLVTGYEPGTYNPFTGLWDVHLNEAHSWAEIYMRRYGWVPLDPTPNSLMGVQPIQDQQSMFQYLAQLLQPYLEKLKESPAMIGLAKLAQNAFGQTAAAFIKTQKHFPELFESALAVAVLLTLAAFAWRIKPVAWRRVMAAGESAAADAISLTEATNEFIAVNKALKRLGLERKQSETGTELLGRVKEIVSTSGMNSQNYLQEMESFLDLYAKIRFGFGCADDLKRLRQLGKELANMTVELSKQKKSAGITQASC